jgi:hypothetical protein
LVKFEGGAVINEPAGPDQVAGKIVSRGLGSEIDFASVTLINAGLVAATHHGLVILDQTNVDNTGGRIAAHGDGSRVQLSDSTIAGGTLATDGHSWTSDSVIEMRAYLTAPSIR